MGTGPGPGAMVRTRGQLGHCPWPFEQLVTLNLGRYLWGRARTCSRAGRFWFFRGPTSLSHPSTGTRGKCLTATAAQLGRQMWSLEKQVTCPIFSSNGTETGKASCVVMGCQCWLIRPPHFLLPTFEPRITGAGPPSAAAPTPFPPTNASPLSFS